MSSHRQKLSKLIDESKKLGDEKYTFHFSDEGRFNLDEEDLVSNFSSKAFELKSDQILRLDTLIQSLRSWATKDNSYAPEYQWFSEGGCRCEVLQVKGKGGGWQRGRFRFRLEFIPDDPEAFLKNCPTEPEKTQSPLDDLRSQLNPE